MEENPAADYSIPFFNLPKDISISIFLKLPSLIIICCMCVCKQWRRLLSDPEFAKMHPNHSVKILKLLFENNFQSFYSVDYDASKEGNSDIVLRNLLLECFPQTKIFVSCNGLIYLDIYHKTEVNVNNYKIILWNPLNGDYKMLPDANPLVNTDGLVGFGYESFSKDYKIVRAIFCPRYQVDVYSLKTNSWKVVESAPPSRSGFNLDAVETTIGRSIYWLMADRKPKCGKSRKRKYIECRRWIVGFDLKDEKFIELQLPPLSQLINYDPVKLMAIGGCLGVYCFYCVELRTIIELWMMKKDKWTKLTTIFADELRKTLWCFMRIRPLCLFENGEVVFYMGEYINYECQRVELLVYDTKVKNVVKTIRLHGIRAYYEFVRYTESLESPNAWAA